MRNARFTTPLIVGAAMLALGLAGGWALSQWRGAGHAPADAASLTERKVLYWYDPMVPTQKFDKPGKSPFMEMQLVPRYADEADAKAAPAVTVSPAAQQSLGLRVATADRRPLAASIDAVGTVVLNERDVALLQARANGFVERVYARAPGDVLRAGAPIADLLLPDWLAAQNEFLAVRATGDAALAAAARQRLVLLGVPPALIGRVESSGRAEAVHTLTAPIGGLLAELAVRPGMAVGTGQTLARINGLATLWVEAAVPEALAAGVAAGQDAEVRLPARPGRALAAKVAAVLPEANREARTLRVRIELPNPGLELRAGLTAQVSLKGAAQGEAVTVPAEAVLRTGRRALVYLLDGPGRYRPVEVELGPEIGDRIAIRRGVEAGQQVVASGQFLIDSEATLQGLTARAPAAAAAAEHEAQGVVSALAGAAITLEHGPVPALQWPAMTMDFVLAEPALARSLKPGDKVRFRFRQQGQESVVTAIEKAAP